MVVHSVIARRVAASAVFALLGVASMPASAQGFFDNLFGGGFQQQQQVAPAPSYDAPPAFYGDIPAARPRAKRKVAVVSEKPKLQKPTDLMRDRTLENGDAVMTKDGLRLYVGDDGASKHDKNDFAGMDNVDNLPKDTRKALLAMESTRHDPLSGPISTDGVSTGRSSAVSTPIVAGREIVDARGKTVRYVGP